MHSIDILANVTTTMMQLTIREWRRLFMEPSRVVGIVLQPILFLTVFGLGFHSSFNLSDSRVRYVDFFFPGILGLVVLFSSIYATLTLVEDKKCGFFRLALIGPGGVLGALLGKIIATFTLAFVQSCLFIPIALILGLNLSTTTTITTIGILALGALVFAVIGVCFAWISPSSSAFHALMSVVLVPLWLLSGAMFPLDKKVLLSISTFNPMTYLVDGLRYSLLGLPGNILLCFIGLSISLFVAVLLLMLAVARRPIE